MSHLPPPSAAARRSRRLACWLALCAACRLAPAHAGDALEGLIQEALASHPAMQLHAARADAAAAAVDGARWQYYPTPSLSIERANSAADPQGAPTVAVLGVTQPLWTGGRLEAGLAAARAQQQASHAAGDLARLDLALRVVQVYGDWLGAHLKQRAYRASADTHVRLRDLVRRRIDQGASAPNDLTLALARLDAVTADLAAVGGQEAVALGRLGQLLGRPVDGAELAARPAEPRALPADGGAMLATVLAAHPALREARAAVRREQAQVAERKADMLPEVYLRLERQHGAGAPGLPRSDSRAFIGLRTRFGAGLSARAAVGAALAQQQAAQAQVALQERLIGEQWHSEWLVLQHAAARAAATRQAAAGAADVAAAYDRQFLAGKRSWPDLMNAARDLAQQQAQLADIDALRLTLSWRLALLSGALPLSIGAPE